MATFPSKVNYATGDILTATNMNDVGNAINTLDGAQTSAGKNRVLNSNFSIWQRGTSISIAASTAYTNGFSADRWQTATGANQALTISRQATGDTTNLPNIQYCMRYQRNSGQTGTGGLTLWQSFESVNSIPLAGKTVTLSFYARAGANYSAASSAFGYTLNGGTGTDQNLGGGYTGNVQLINQTATLTTTWQRFSYSATVTSTITELTPNFYFAPTGTASTNDYFEITGVQLETANTASPYAPNAATYQAELAACQRYFYQISNGNVSAPYGIGYAKSTSSANVYIQFPVQMRVNPPSVAFSTLAFYESGVAFYPIGAFAADGVSTLGINLSATSITGTLVLGKPYILANNNSTAGYLAVSADL